MLGKPSPPAKHPDETGLVYYRARYYDPAVGRFVSRDPIGLQGGINQYAYVGNNPVNLTDPLGLQAQSPLILAQSGNYFQTTLTDVAQSLAKVVPGGEGMRNATASYNAGNYGTAVLWGVGALADVALTAGTGGESAAAKTAVEAVAPSILKNVTNDGIGYNSSRALRNAMSPASGEQIHHIVEQTPSNIANFGAQVIHNTANAVPVAADIHIGQGSISAYYSSKVPSISGDQTIRQWLNGQSFDAQYGFGLRTLRDFGVLP